MRKLRPRAHKGFVQSHKESITKPALQLGFLAPGSVHSMSNKINELDDPQRQVIVSGIQPGREAGMIWASSYLPFKGQTMEAGATSCSLHFLLLDRVIA